MTRIVETAIRNAQLQDVVQTNSQQNFEFVFRKIFEDLSTERIQGNEDVFPRVFSDAEQYHSGKVYRRIMAQVEESQKMNSI